MKTEQKLKTRLERAVKRICRYEKLWKESERGHTATGDMAEAAACRERAYAYGVSSKILQKVLR